MHGAAIVAVLLMQNLVQEVIWNFVVHSDTIPGLRYLVAP